MLAEFAKRGGAREDMHLKLMSLGDIITSGGKGFRNGEELRGYNDPLQPVVVDMTLQLKDPGYILQGLDILNAY